MFVCSHVLHLLALIFSSKLFLVVVYLQVELHLLMVFSQRDLCFPKKFKSSIPPPSSSHSLILQLLLSLDIHNLCLVAWNNICKPVGYGGLGVKNLQIQALALRVRWDWLRRVDPEGPWQGILLFVDKEARQVFDSLVKIKVGNGERVVFWKD